VFEGLEKSASLLKRTYTKKEKRKTRIAYFCANAGGRK
jgi:hypothetical protein